MDKIALQAKLDEQKWNDSVTNHRDMCGGYDYCAFCDKSVALPCASAYEEMNKPKVVEKPQPAVVEKEEEQDVTTLDSSLGKKFDYDKVMAKKAARKSLTFAEKYALSDEIVKERYAILKDALTATPKGTPKIKSRISKQCDTYRREGDIIAKVTIIGTSLLSISPSIRKHPSSTTVAPPTPQRDTRKSMRTFPSNSRSTASLH